MRTIAFIQCRMTSSRLPGKALLKFGDKSLTHFMIERVKKSKMLNGVVAIMPDEESEDILQDELESNGIDCFRGHPTNLVDRFYQAACKYNADHIVRLTGDCPFIDFQIIDRVINEHLNSEGHYTSNVRPASFPDGLDVEVFSRHALDDAFKNASTPRELEHVGPYIINNFEILNIENQVDHSKLRWTIDEPEDYEFAKKLLVLLGEKAMSAGYEEILEVIENNKDIMSLNHHFERNAGSKNQK